jgi:hypothetical protein
MNGFLIEINAKPIPKRIPESSDKTLLEQRLKGVMIKDKALIIEQQLSKDSNNCSSTESQTLSFTTESAITSSILNKNSSKYCCS